MTERKRRFAEAYVRLANATKAAVEAGYSARTAYSAGPRALRDVEVLALIDSRRIKRDVHAETTYRELIAVKDIAIEEVSKARKETPRDSERLIRALEMARRALETVGKCEGVFIERLVLSGPHGAPLPQGPTINVALLQSPDRLREVLDLARGAGMLDVLMPRPAIPRIEILQPPQNGNGNGNGAHDSHA